MRIIENVLTREELGWAQKLAAEGRFSDGRGSAGGAAGTVKQNQQLEMTPEAGQQLCGMVIAALQRSNRFYRAALPLEISTPMINRYAPGMCYGPHYDSPVFHAPNGSQVRGDLSVTLFISNPADYDGGELHDSMSGKRVKLDAGSLVVYPSGGLHEVTPVTRGARHAIIFWVQSMVRDHEQRALLASLDECVEKVSSRLPASDEVRQLTGVFANLGRMWINT
jgi:PKHD-type hydroxylase